MHRILGSSRVRDWGGVLILAALFVTTRNANADYQQLTCPTGPTNNGASYTAPIPVDLGAGDFDNQTNASGGTRLGYGLNENYVWATYVNGNVQWAWPHLSDFNTESGYDYLQFNSTQFTGNLGTAWASGVFGAFSPGYYDVRWVSDVSVSTTSTPRFDAMKFDCLSSQSTTAPVRSFPTATQLNNRIDVILLGDNDTIYFSAVLEDHSQYTITVDANANSNAPTSADLDLYASYSYSRPSAAICDYFDQNYGSDLPTAGAQILLPARIVTTPPPGTHDPAHYSTVYFGLHAYSGAGHYTVRIDRQTEHYVAHVCTQDITPAALFASAGFADIKKTLSEAALHMFHATDGYLFFNEFDFRQESASLHSYTDSDKFCTQNSWCDMCMTAYGPVNTKGFDVCGYQGDSTGRMRIPSNQCQDGGQDPANSRGNWDQADGLAVLLTHEMGHAIRRLVMHSDVGRGLKDEYFYNLNGTNVSNPMDAHSFMNGPYTTVTATGSTVPYRFSTDLNHCQPNDAWVSPVFCAASQSNETLCCDPVSDWGLLINWFGYRVNGGDGISLSHSAQPGWRTYLNEWARENIAFTQN